MSRRPYIRPVAQTTWFLHHRRYRIYMLREVTCLLVGFYAFFTIFALAALAAGADQWNRFLAAQQNPVMAGFHAAALLYFLLFQMIPWFRLAPKAMPVRLGERKVPAGMIVFGHYAAWAVLSALIFRLAGAF